LLLRAFEEVHTIQEQLDVLSADAAAVAVVLNELLDEWP
jgi:hypothetical protein